MSDKKLGKEVAIEVDNTRTLFICIYTIKNDFFSFKKKSLTTISNSSSLGYTQCIQYREPHLLSFEGRILILNIIRYCASIVQLTTLLNK